MEICREPDAVGPFGTYLTPCSRELAGFVKDLREKGVAIDLVAYRDRQRSD